nr:hypothetical protein [Bacteroidota bacterium]
MKTFKIISFVCFALVAILGFIFAAIYLFKPEFMPYHADAVSMEWVEVNPDFRVLIIALMRVAGGGWLATSLSITFLLIASRRFNNDWLKIALVVVGLAALIPSLYATLYVKSHSPAEPPWIAAAVAIFLLLVALFFDLLKPSK